MKYFLRLAFYSEKQFSRKTGYLFYRDLLRIANHYGPTGHLTQFT